MLVVIDTNVIISGFISPHETSATHQIFNRILNGQLQPAFSIATFEELRTRIERPKFEKYGSIFERKLTSLLIQDAGKMFSPDEIVLDSIDPDDNKFLELAYKAKVEFIVSGDKKHLLSLSPWRSINIVTPRNFVDCHLVDQEKD